MKNCKILWGQGASFLFVVLLAVLKCQSFQSEFSFFSHLLLDKVVRLASKWNSTRGIFKGGLSNALIKLKGSTTSLKHIGQGHCSIGWQQRWCATDFRLISYSALEGSRVISTSNNYYLNAWENFAQATINISLCSTYLSFTQLKHSTWKWANNNIAKLWNW